MSRTKRTTLLGVALVATFLIALPSMAQRYNDYEDEDDGIRQTVARVAYLTGDASYNRGDDPDEWQPATINFPMTQGDRLYTNRGSRIELQMQTARIFLAPETDLAALDLMDDISQLSLSLGTASFRLRRLSDREIFEVATPNVSVTFRSSGSYRVDVNRDGDTVVTVWKGSALVSSGGGEVLLEERDRMVIEGSDRPRYDISSARRSDSWDRWVDSRSRRPPTYNASYVNADIEGIDDLDTYGNWEQIPEHGWAWTPSQVNVGWQPYVDGRWMWQDPWGWTWVSSEPWGWAPYHYGRWVSTRQRWYWIPVGPRARNTRYSPALVAFVGGGAGWSASVSIGGGGFVGWFPLAPRDPFVRWWGPRGHQNVSNFNYVNRSRVTIVRRDTFAGGRVVTNGIVRDARVIRDVSSAPVIRGPIPILPTTASIRVSTSGRNVTKPSITSVSRTVVTREAPPPAPMPFQEKEQLIKNNAGAPVEWQSLRATRSAEAPKKPVVSVRSAAPESGQITLAPRDNSAPVRRVQPATAPSRREPSTGPDGAPQFSSPNLTSPKPRVNEPVTIQPQGQDRPAPSFSDRPSNVPPTPRSETQQFSPSQNDRMKDPRPAPQEQSRQQEIRSAPTRPPEIRSEPIRRDPPIEQRRLQPIPQKPVEQPQMKVVPPKEKEAKPEKVEKPMKKPPKTEEEKEKDKDPKR